MIMLNIMLFYSFHALCGLLFTNQRGSVCLGSPIGYVQLHLVLIIYLMAFEVQSWNIYSLSNWIWGTLFSDMHYTWPSFDDSVTNRWIKANCTQCQNLWFLPIGGLRKIIHLIYSFYTFIYGYI
jgi:hypothetical protein